MKKAIIIGHNITNRGAFSATLNKYEWDFYMDMIQELNKLGEVFIHDEDIKSYTSRMKDTAKKINQKDFDIVVALHFNAFNGTASGCEALYYHTNKQGKAKSSIFCEKFCQATGIKNRGAKPLDSSRDRGFGEIAYTKATTLILEPFFGDNDKDCKKYSKTALLEAIKSL